MSQCACLRFLADSKIIGVTAYEELLRGSSRGETEFIIILCEKAFSYRFIKKLLPFNKNPKL